jgi:4-aminobutyrate aminotransferase-like enzyme
MESPSLSSQEIAETANLFVPCVRRWFGDEPILFVEGNGAVLKDSGGKEYLDLYSSHGCAALVGYNHPALRKALKKQADQLYSLSVEFPTLPVIRLAEKLLEITPESFNRVYFANAGAEAVEAGLFLAKKHTKKHELITLYGAFHGRTHGVRSLLGFAPFRQGVGPLLPGIIHLPAYYCYRCQLKLEYPDCELQCAKMLEETLLYGSSGEAAVFIAEPIQGTAGNIPAPDGYFQEIKKILDKHDIPLFLDEIYTALGCTGKLFCYEHYGVVPDLMTMSKTLGNGLPVSALLTSDAIAQAFAPPEPPLYYTTFGSNPLMTAAALASVNTIIKERLWERAAKMGEYWMKGLKKLQEKHEIIGDVRGKGVMIGVELVKDRKTKEPAKEESQKLKMEAGKRGVIMPAGFGWLGNTIKLHPSLIMTEDQIDKALYVLDESLKAIA